MQLIFASSAIARRFARPFCQVRSANRHKLERRKILTRNLPPGGSIRCVGGVLWITGDGDPRDIVLREGEIFTCPRRGRVILEALEDALVEFCP